MRVFRYQVDGAVDVAKPPFLFSRVGVIFLFKRVSLLATFVPTFVSSY